MHGQAAAAAARSCGVASSSGSAPRVDSRVPRRTSLVSTSRCHGFGSVQWGSGGSFAGALLPPRARQVPRLEVWPFDQAWGASVDTKTFLAALPSNLFAFSIIPYGGFLYHLTRSKKAPPLMLFGFYFLLAFVFATIPAGIYAKRVYGTSLANVDYLHGSAEFLLTLTNLFIVLGLRQGIRQAEEKTRQQQQQRQAQAAPAADEPAGERKLQ